MAKLELAPPRRAFRNHDRRLEARRADHRGAARTRLARSRRRARPRNRSPGAEGGQGLTMAEQTEASRLVEEGSEYKWGWTTDIESDVAPPGLDEDTIRFISAKKNEPEFMLEWRLRAYRAWVKMTREEGEPRWANVK